MAICAESWQPRISIHAPREGGDSKDINTQFRDFAFQSTPPVRGGDRKSPLRRTKKPSFQSTPPARGATGYPGTQCLCAGISIHAPREGGDSKDINTQFRDFAFQSTPPVRGGDRKSPLRRTKKPSFQSTPPARGATHRPCPLGAVRYISIHAPREGGDSLI